MYKKIKYLIFIIFAFVLLPLYTNPNLKAEDISQVNIVDNISSKQLDKRAQILNDYLQKYDSPLQYHAQDFVDAADNAGIDWKLVAAISGVESTFGKFVPGGSNTPYNSFNAWGWGAATPDDAIYFKSWKEGIFTVSDGLKKNYISKGLTDPYSINKVYAASPTWGQKVSYFLNDLDIFTKKYEAEKPVQKNGNAFIKIAGASAQLAYR